MSRATEIRAVNFISTLIAMCPLLTPYIEEGDRTSLTDGFIDIYSSEKKINATTVGRVDVQVKGRMLKEGEVAPATFGIKTADLRAYLKLSCVLFLVVDLESTSTKAEAQYVILHPFKIQRILAPLRRTQKAVTVKLKRFPERAEEIEAVVQMAESMKVQDPTQTVDRALFEHVTAFDLRGLGELDLDKPVLLSAETDDFLLVAKTGGGMRIPLPGDFEILPDDYVPKPIEATISSGGVDFVNPVRRRVDDTTVELRLGENLTWTLVLPPSRGPSSLTIDFSDVLSERLRDLEFYFACLETGEIAVNGSPATTGVVDPEIDDELRQHLGYLRRFGSLCKRLGADTSLIRLSEVGEDVAARLGVIDRWLSENALATGNPGEQGRLFQPVGDRGLELMVREKDCERSLFDTFANPAPYAMIQVGENDAGEPTCWPVTPYEMLNANEMVRTLNLHLNSIVHHYMGLQQPKHAATLANQTVLNLILAADLDDERRHELLSGAEGLNKWVISIDGALPIHQLNQMQIAARQRELTDAERESVRALRRQAIRDDQDNSLQMELGCAILLGDSEDIADVISQLSSEQLAEFRTWPLWNLAGAEKVEMPSPSERVLPDLRIKYLDADDADDD